MMFGLLSLLVSLPVILLFIRLPKEVEESKSETEAVNPLIEDEGLTASRSKKK